MPCFDLRTLVVRAGTCSASIARSACCASLGLSVRLRRAPPAINLGVDVPDESMEPENDEAPQSDESAAIGTRARAQDESMEVDEDSEQAVIGFQL